MKKFLTQVITLLIGVILSVVIAIMAINTWSLSAPVAAVMTLPIMLSALFIAAYLTDETSPLDGAWENDEYSAYKE